jgi:hypothetical protein
VRKVSKPTHRGEHKWEFSGSIEGFAGAKSKHELGKLLQGVVAIYKEGALRLTPISAIAQGNCIAAEVTGYAELTNGRVYQPQSAFFFEVADGKITQIREYLDTQHAYEIFFVQ